jgi:hypothetical protein
VSVGIKKSEEEGRREKIGRRMRNVAKVRRCVEAEGEEEERIAKRKSQMTASI